MPEVDLKRLRDLRAKAEKLLSTVVTDLQPFLHKTDKLSFRRKPDSDSREGDIGVTTTCSCLMALALMRKFEDVYKPSDDDEWTEEKAQKRAAEAFRSLFTVSWMSSGLVENNAFTTTLVLRALGYLVEEGSLSSDEEVTKAWKINAGIGKPLALAEKIEARSDEMTKFLYQSFSDSTKEKIDQWLKDKTDKVLRGQLTDAVTVELNKVIHGSCIYHENRFPELELSEETEEALKKIPTGNDLPRVHRMLLGDAFRDEVGPLPLRSLSDIALELAKDIEHFSINRYPPAAAVVYWFIDGVKRAKLEFGDEELEPLSRWATREFNRHRSLIAANHDAVMDPIALAMSACLCHRIRLIVKQSNKFEALPSEVELMDSIRTVLSKQTPTGIWPKYFPMFHYQEAGSNFCFTFEMLEAVLVEFGGHEEALFSDDHAMRHLEGAVEWCKRNRVPPKSDETYYGWNSGGDLETLKKGQPESWATAVVHMFLWELVKALSHHIQQRILVKYQALAPGGEVKALSEVLDTEILIQGGKKGLKEIIKKSFITNRPGKDQLLQGELLEAPRSALLFGPPGTSKTGLTRTIATELKWPIILLDPSHFLKQGLGNIYVQAEEIFDDLMDLTGVVVFFDEMDALGQTRDSENRLDTTSQFLTTFMLPKLAELHGRKSAIFFMATNFQENFDAALKRAGRFDLLLCVGPPTLAAKLDRLEVFFELKNATDQTIKATTLLRQWTSDNRDLARKLHLYTFDEFKLLLNRLGMAADIGDELESLQKKGFEAEIEKDSRYVALNLLGLKSLFMKARKPWLKTVDDVHKCNWTLDEMRKKGVRIDATIRYGLDMQESKEQG